MPYKDLVKAREHAKLRARKYRLKPGVNERAAEAMRLLREDPAFVANERAQQKESRANPETRPARLTGVRERNRKQRQFFNLLKEERGCYDCGGMFPAEALDWDHLPGKEKCFNIGPNVSHFNRDKVFAEIAKCQVVCATCHRIRTTNRKQQEKEN